MFDNLNWRYHKTVVDGIIIQIGGGTSVHESHVEITKEKYDELDAKFGNHPEETVDTMYRFVDETESYEPFKRTYEQKVDWYKMMVINGTCTIDEVPEEFKTDVEAVLPQKTVSEDYQSGYDQAVLDMVEQGVL